MTVKPGDVSQPKDYPLIVEKDVRIPLRDGTLLCADVYRPDGGDERFPLIMNLGPWQRCFVPKPLSLVRLQRLAKFGVIKSAANFLRCELNRHGKED